MGVRRFFTTTITVRRLKAGSGFHKALQATATVDCDIRSLDRETRQRLGITEERIWVAYFDAEGFSMQKGDVIFDASGNRYQVLEYTPKTYDYGINQFKEVFLTEYNDD